MSADKSWGIDYLQKQYKAMRWLAKQGVSLENIRNMRWGMVDEIARTISVKTEVVYLQYDMEKGFVKRDVVERELKIPLKDTECENFFIKSRIYCAWMFTREKPKTWRKEISKASLFTPVEIEKALKSDPELQEVDTSVLTNPDIFVTIGLSNLNITKMKTKELEEEAKVV